MTLEILEYIIPFLAIFLFIFIFIVYIISSFKISNLKNLITYRYPNIEKKIPIFRIKGISNSKNKFKDLHSLKLKRILFIQTFSKKQSKQFYSKLFRVDLLNKIKDRNMKKQVLNTINWTCLDDICRSVWIIFMLLLLIIGIIYSFYH